MLHPGIFYDRKRDQNPPATTLEKHVVGICSLGCGGTFEGNGVNALAQANAEFHAHNQDHQYMAELTIIKEQMEPVRERGSISGEIEV